MSEKFDIIVIGGGAGGLFAASVANALGAKTCMIDKERLGGDCTWFGCMPSKALLKTAHIAGLLKNAEKAGLSFGAKPVFNTDKVMAHVRNIVQEISTHHPPEVFEKRGISVKFGKVQFIDKNSISLNDDTLTAKKFIICTGSHPVIPPISGLKDITYLTNETVFELDKLPESLIVLGGGPIGIELSQSFSLLGVKVSVVEMLDRVLFREDRQVSEILEKKLIEDGIGLYTGKKAVKFEEKGNLIICSLEDKDGKHEKISAEEVLVAVGRAANLDGLDLEKAQVEYTKQSVKVNDYLQTTNPDIFACGDIVGPYMFSHVAAYQASVSVRNALLKKIAWQKVNYSNVAWATFTDPEVSHLGMTEEEAREKLRNINVYTTEYGSSDRAVTDLENNGLVKIITDKKGFIAGASIVGAKASEIMQGLIIAKSQKIPLEKISSALFIYPTLSELIKKTAAKPFISKANNPLIKLALKILKRA